MSFKATVIEIIKKIPRGKVTTYGTIATVAGFPRNAKFVGGVLHFNSDEYDLPWQRVINKAGYISNNCPEHVKALQKALLEGEGVEVDSNFMIDLEKYGWWGK